MNPVDFDLAPLTEGRRVEGMNPALARPQVDLGGVPARDGAAARILHLAVELTCIAVRTGDCDEGVRRAIAAKIIKFAKSGNPDILAEQALQEIRGPHGARRLANGLLHSLE